MTTTETAGRELKGLRAKMDYSLDAVCELARNEGIKLNRDELSKYEKDLINMKISKLIILLEIYDVTLDYFFREVCANSRRSNG